MTHLSVNLNKIALVRNSRTIGIPSVLWAAETCIEAGAHGLTVHPRPDERHIRRSDVYELAELLKAHPTIEFNIEGNPLEPPFMQIVQDVRPTQATLVPDDPNQFTSDRGWDIGKNGDKLKPIVEELQAIGARVSLFMDPDPDQIRKIKPLGVAHEMARIELYTEPYATAVREKQANADALFGQYAEAAKVAQAEGLGVNAGHDLNLENLPQFLSIPNILEVSIGHALTADALKLGLYDAVKAYLKLL